MSSPPQPKRRRIGIHKPFISPLKRADSSIATAENTPTRISTSNLRNETTPESLAIRQLESRIRELRAQNTILQQAVATTTSTATSTNTTSATPTTQQPSRLETKWRRASQAAADTVFHDFSTRIRDNGGYAAFLRQQSTYKPFYSDHSNDTNNNNNNSDNKTTQGDEEDWRDEMGDVLTARGKKQRRRENEDKVKKQEEDEEEQEEQELGMGSMLQVLNIPFEVIGWDEKEQAWK
ncbi:hypothetical protein D6D28_09267 [Aureobasidium pullulans]|uniref:Uncharacterized protein n=1 Tax=Aureobasidium pullulans TaxID=5580 RepID=A0A4S8S524_AURPU|nr:hypothetical protein D6D28_09267 [Aureobasidium pullulans]